MAGRPPKQTADYFFHETTSGRTIFMLESKWGNDGYAFFHKLMELLCTTEGMALDCSDKATWEFLLAKTRVEDITATEILNFLAEIKKIDPELWQYKIIWYQKLVDNLAPLYEKRKTALPTKPVILDEKSIPETINTTEVEFAENKLEQNDISDNKNTPIISYSIISNSIIPPISPQGEEDEEDKFDFVKHFGENYPIPNMRWKDELIALGEEYPETWLKEATKRFLQAGATSINYLTKTLRSWKKTGGKEPWHTSRGQPVSGTEWAAQLEKERPKKPDPDCPQCKGEGVFKAMQDGLEMAYICDCKEKYRGDG